MDGVHKIITRPRFAMSPSQMNKSINGERAERDVLASPVSFPEVTTRCHLNQQNKRASGKPRSAGPPSTHPHPTPPPALLSPHWVTFQTGEKSKVITEGKRHQTACLCFPTEAMRRSVIKAAILEVITIRRSHISS